MPQVQIIEPTIKPQEQKIRVCAYARVSSDSDDQLNSFSAQVEYFTQLIQSHSDWEFVDIYADEGITGTRADKRNDFQRLMRDCQSGRIDCILVKSVSRFARNSTDCIKAVRELQALGISVIFEKEQINTGALTNEMFLSMMSAFAQEEAISISQNMRRGAVMRMKNGTFRLSQIPYGYRYDEHGVLTIQSEEAETVRWIYSSFLSGVGIQTISHQLGAKQIPKLSGKPVWSKHGILYILTNERYTGSELFRKSYRTESIPFRKINNHGEKTQFYVENTHEPIINKETFEKVQALLKEKKEKHGKKQSTKDFPLTKMVFCEECGSVCYRRITSQGIMWTCSNHLADLSRCSTKGILEDTIYKAFLSLTNKLEQNQSEILETFLLQIQKLRDREYMAHPGVIKLNQEIAELLKQNHTLATLRAKEYIDSAFFISQTNELDQKISSLRAELKRYRDLNDYQELIRGTQAVLETLSKTTSNSFHPSTLKKIISKIIAGPKSLKFQLINSLELIEPIER